MALPQIGRLGCRRDGVALRRELRVQLGPVRVGADLGAVAAEQPRVRRRAGGVEQLDEQLHRRTGDAGHVADAGVGDVCVFRRPDVRWGGIYLVGGSRDEEVDVGGDGWIVWGGWDGSSSEFSFLLFVLFLSVEGDGWLDVFIEANYEICRIRSVWRGFMRSWVLIRFLMS